MARILIGWELGANRGHAERLARLGATLRDKGHDIVFAVQRLDAFAPDQAAGDPVWQAPLSPRLLVTVPKGPLPPPVGMADILARLGMDDGALVAAVLRGWQRIFAAVAPALVIADFAPFLLLAARGRLPTIAVGNGFSLPPAGMAAFPSLVAGNGVDQSALTEQVNAALAGTGGAAIRGLPQVFAADRSLPATFAELDPYRSRRDDALICPLPADFEAAASDGEELFVYGPESLPPDSPLWKGLAQSGLVVRVHVPRAAPRLREAVQALGLLFEPEPLPLPLIARRSRLLLSHGGHGLVCAGLAAGLPHVVVHADLEKLSYGHALARAGLGGHVALHALRPDAFAASLRRVHGDDALAARARAAAPDFLARDRRDQPSLVAQAAADLVA